MFEKIINLIQENRNNQKQIIGITRELNWANVYHDSIRGKKWLEKLPLNVGRWGSNYAFFYLMNRILSDIQPKSILELGLGESTKFISAFLCEELHSTTHIVIEQNQVWKDTYMAKNHIPSNTRIVMSDVVPEMVNGYESLTYDLIPEVISQKFDLYVVDGPIGTPNYSRFDLIKIAKSLTEGDEFIILLDDYERKGERETVGIMLKVFKEKKMKVYVIGFPGIKHLIAITSKKYKYISSF